MWLGSTWVRGCGSPHRAPWSICASGHMLPDVGEGNAHSNISGVSYIKQHLSLVRKKDGEKIIMAAMQYNNCGALFSNLSREGALNSPPTVSIDLIRRCM